MKNLKLGTKIYLLVAACLLAGAGSTAFLLYRTSSITATYDALLAGEIHQRSVAREMQVGFKKQVQEWKNILLRGDDPKSFEKYVDGFRDEEKFVQERAAELRSATEDPAILEVLDEFETAHNELGTKYADAIQAFAKDLDYKAADKRVKGLDRPPTDLIDTLVARLAVADATSSQQAAVVAERNAVIVVFLLLFGALSVLAYGMIRSITRPVAQLSDAARHIAVGDLDQQIDYRSADEIGVLADAFRGMIEYINAVAAAVAAIGRGETGIDLEPRSEQDVLSYHAIAAGKSLENMVAEASRISDATRDGDLAVRGDVAELRGAYRDVVAGLNEALDAVVAPIDEAATVLERVAERDLSARVEGSYRGDHAKIKNALNAAVENLDQALAQVGASSEQVSAASTEITAGSQNLAQGASEQASSLEEISSSLQELASMARQTSANSQEVRSLAEEAKSSSAQGNQHMTQMSQAMNAIKGSATETAKIVKTIDEIAFQTNLLALNAAVEAARAGEAGKGFAVVAEEVRNLAMRSAEAAKQTAELIEASGENVERGAALSEEVRASLEQIVSGVTKVGEVIAEVAAASEQQTQGVDQISTAVEELNGVTQQNAANSEESAATAEELSSQAAVLSGMVGEFTLSGSGGATRRTGSRQPVKRSVTPAPKKVTISAAISNRAASKPAQPKKGNGNGKSRITPEEMIPFGDEVDEAVLSEF